MIHPTAAKKWCECDVVGSKSGDIGVELEIEGENLPREVSGWIVKHEGSLRGKNGRTTTQGENLPDTPMEYVLYRPCGLDLLKTKLKALKKILTTEGVKVVLTPRASTHIHINMTNETIRTIIGYTVIFTIIEPVLLRLCGPERNGNLFCLPSYETGDLPFVMEKVSLAVMNGVRRYWPGKRGKYAALNLDPLMSFGSVEARCFPNTIEPDAIHTWATWMLNIRTLASEWSDETYMTLLDKAYDDPTWLLSTLFGDTELFSACQPHTPYELIAYGVEQGYELARAARPVLAWNNSVKQAPQFKPNDWLDFEPTSTVAYPLDSPLDPPEPDDFYDGPELD